MAAIRRAFLDANVLRGQLTTDVLLTLAFNEHFDARWSQDVLNEVRKNRPPGLPEAAIDRRLATMNRALPDAMTSGYEHLMPAMRADEKDKHVLAAAVRSNSDVLVTENIKDFDPPASGPHAVQVEKLSDFLNRLLDDRPQEVIDSLKEMVSRTSREPNSLSALIDKLAAQHDLKGFAHRLNAVVSPEDRGTHAGLQAGQSARVALDGVVPAAGAVNKPAAAPGTRRVSPAAGKGPDKEL